MTKTDGSSVHGRGGKRTPPGRMPLAAWAGLFIVAGVLLSVAAARVLSLLGSWTARGLVWLGVLAAIGVATGIGYAAVAGRRAGSGVRGRKEDLP